MWGWSFSCPGVSTTTWERCFNLADVHLFLCFLYCLYTSAGGIATRSDLAYASKALLWWAQRPSCLMSVMPEPFKDSSEALPCLKECGVMFNCLHSVCRRQMSSQFMTSFLVRGWPSVLQKKYLAFWGRKFWYFSNTSFALCGSLFQLMVWCLIKLPYLEVLSDSNIIDKPIFDVHTQWLLTLWFLFPWPVWENSDILMEKP